MQRNCLLSQSLFQASKITIPCCSQGAEVYLTWGEGQGFKGEAGAEDWEGEVPEVLRLRPLASDWRLRSGRRVVAALAGLFWK